MLDFGRFFGFGELPFDVRFPSFTSFFDGPISNLVMYYADGIFTSVGFTYLFKNLNDRDIDLCVPVVLVFWVPSLSLSLDVGTQIWFKDNSGLRNDA